MASPDCTSDQFDEMLHGVPWMVYRERLAAMLEAKRRELEGSLNASQTDLCRGWCQALRRVIEEVPQAIIAELEEDD